MATPDSGVIKGILYLEQIDIVTRTRTNVRIKLQKDQNDVKIQRKKGTSSWVLCPRLELFDVSRITITGKSSPFSLENSGVLAEINGEEAMEAFWDSKETVSCPATVNQQLGTVTFRFCPSHTSETMRAAVHNLQTAMTGYKRLIPGSAEERIDLVIKFGIILAQMNPVAKLAFGLARATFDLLKEQQKYDDNVSDLARGISGLLPFAERALEGVLYEEGLLDGVVRRLYNLIGDTADFIINYAKRGPAMRALRSLILPKDHETIRGLQGDFSKLKADFDRAVDVAVLTLARRSEESSLLNRLNPVEAANYQDNHSCMDGTRTTILDEIVAWATKPFKNETQPNCSSSNVFWLYGMPGVGKTSVANSLCGRLRKNGNLGASFICKHDIPSLRKPEVVLPTLIAKLVRMWGPLRKLVAQVLHDEPQINPESTDGELLLKPLRLLKKHPPVPLVLVIDALDECGRPSTRARLLKCLTEACSIVHWLKIVVTSRPERDIESFFDGHHITRRDLATDDLKGEDIRLFTEIRMAEIQANRYLPTGWPGPERVNRIVERSRGLFIFVDTLSRLVDIPQPEPLLDEVLDGRVEEANAELHRLYSMAITSRRVQHTKEFYSILRAVIAVSAFRPLCAETLAKLIDLGVPTVLSWVDELSSLLYKDETMNGGIRVRNLSILEFLVGSTCPPEFRVDMTLANLELARCCVGTMVKQLKFNICELESSHLPNTDIPDLNDRVKKRIPDALQYSCMHWSDHLCFEIDLVSPEVGRLLDDFFAESRPLYWLEVLSLMGKVPVAILGLRLLKECLEACKSKDQRQRLIAVEDALRFVLVFFTPISTSAPHIYVSSIPFTPMESIIWNNASDLFPEILNVCKGRMDSWPAPSGILEGHSDWVRSVAYSSDGRNVVSGSSDNTIRIWDAQTGAPMGAPWIGHDGPVWSVAYSPDGRTVVSSSEDKTIRMWDAQTGASMGAPWIGHDGPVWSVAYSPDGCNIVSSSEDKTIRIWNVHTGAVTRKLIGHTGNVCRVVYSPDGPNIASGAYDKTIRIWDARTGAAVGKPLTGHTGWVCSVAYSPDSRRIVSGSTDDTIRIWDAQTGEAVGGPLTEHSRTVGSVTYSPDGKSIISGSDDNTIRIWDAKTGEGVREPLTGHAHYVRSVAYSPDGCQVVSGSSDNTIRIWDAKTGAVVGEPLAGHAQYVRSVAYSPDGNYLVSGSPGNAIRIWDVRTGVAMGEPLSGHTGWVWSIAYSPDGGNIATGSEDMTIRIWDTQTGAVMPLIGHNGPIWSVAYSPDGRTVVSGSRDKTIRIWDARTGETIREMIGHTRNVCGVAYSPDGLCVASSAEDKTIRIWDARTGAAMGEPLSGHTDWVWSIAYSPDGRNVASYSTDGTIRIWDIQTGAAVGEPLIGHTRAVGTVAYSPDGRRLISGSDDNTIRIWDAQTGAAVGEPLTGHTHYVRSVKYSPDGRYFVSGSSDNTIRIWNAEASIEKDSRRIVPDSMSLPGDQLSLNALSGRPIPAKLLNSDGWVRDADGLLFWTPEDCHAGMVCPAITAIPNTGRRRCVRIDFAHFKYGKSWTSIRRRRSPGHDPE